MLDLKKLKTHKGKMKNQIKPINTQKLKAIESFKYDLDALYGNIEELLRDDCLESYPELSFALQEVNSLIEGMDIKIDYYQS